MANCFSTASPLALNYPSLAHGIAQYLSTGLHQIQGGEGPTTIPLSASIEPGKYGSPIALVLAKPWQRTAQSIANQLQSSLQSMFPPDALASPGLVIQVQDNGWLSFETSAQTQVQGLQQLFSQRTLVSVTPSGQSPTPFAAPTQTQPPLFQLQYAHARCCALLRLAQDVLNWDGSTQTLLNPDLLDALPADSAERQLWRSLLNFPLSLLPSQQIHPKTLQNSADSLWISPVEIPWPLSQKCQCMLLNQWNKLFQLFYGQSRILGESARRSPQLCNFRIGLILLLKSVVEFILTHVWQAQAPNFL